VVNGGIIGYLIDGAVDHDVGLRIGLVKECHAAFRDKFLAAALAEYGIYRRTDDIGILRGHRKEVALGIEIQP